MRLLALALSFAALLARGPAAQDAVLGGRDGVRILGGSVSGTWTRGASPYLVLGDILVGDLVVEAGVEVRSAPGVEIRVQGSLASRGTAERPVRFTSLDPSKRWDGLVLWLATGASSFTHTRIERAAQRGLQIEGTVVSRFSHCEIVDNAAGGLGINSPVGNFHMEDCLVEDNTITEVNSVNGAGIAVLLSGSFSMERCTVRGNRALATPCGEAAGGGVQILSAFDVALTDVLIEDNECFAVSGPLFTCSCFAQAYGGGLAFGYDGAGGFDATLTRCIVRGNRALVADGGNSNCGAIDAFGEGGGIYFSSASDRDLTLVNTIVAGNVVWVDGDDQWARGAAVYFQGDVLDVTNSTLARNVAVDGQSTPGITLVLAPGVYMDFGSVASLRSSIFFHNTTCVALVPPGTGACSGAPQGADPIQGPALVTAVYCDVQGTQAGTGNLAEPPLLAGPGLSYADLSIAPGSPCIDAGDPSAAYDDVSFPPSLGGARNDIGHNGGPLAGGWIGWPVP